MRRGLSGGRTKDMSDLFTSPDRIILAAGLLFFASVLANRLSDRLGIPTLLMFLAIGMTAGSDGLGLIDFDNPAIANFIGIFALAYILFAGGLDTDWRTVRPVLGPGLILATAGVVLTALFTGLFAWLALGFPLKDGLLLGAIISSTDAAAVFAILRARGVRLKGRLKPLLELESGSNDPMAVFLTLAVIGILTRTADTSWPALVFSLAVNIIAGVGLGAATGFFAAWVFDRLNLEYEGLYPVLGMSLVLLAYGLARLLGGNGFLAVYTCGIILGNQDFLHKHYLVKFHDGLGWLMQINLFLALGLLVYPSRLPAIAGTALLVSAFLMFVARPAAVYLGLWRSQFTPAERTLVAWTGLRGAVPIVLATFPFTAGYPHSDTLFNIVFFVVLTSTLIQGGTLMALARWLGVNAPLLPRPQSPLEFERRAGVKSEAREVDIPADAVVAGKTISEIRLPPDVLILLIRRGEEFIVARGQTRIAALDTVQFIASESSLEEAQDILTLSQAALPAPEDSPPAAE